MCEGTEITPEQRRAAWLRRLIEEFIKLGRLFPESMVSQAFMPEDDRPQWVQRVETEIGDVMMPAAHVKEEPELTPKRLNH